MSGPQVMGSRIRGSRWKAGLGSRVCLCRCSSAPYLVWGWEGGTHSGTYACLEAGQADTDPILGLSLLG